MSSTKKRARSPEVGGLLPTHQRTSVQARRNAPPKICCRGPRDDRLKALLKLDNKRKRLNDPSDTPYRPNIASSPQLNTRVRRTAPVPVKSSPLRRNSPGLTVPHSPPSLPAEYDEGGPEIFNGSPGGPHVSPASGLHTAFSVRDDRALFHRTRHLDNHTSAWNQR